MSLRDMEIFKHYDFENWIAGMLTALSTGIATAGSASFALYLQDPKDYNPFEGRFWITFGTVLTLSGGSNFFAYLKQNPAPRRLVQEGTRTTTGPGGEKTVETTKTSISISEPKEQEPKETPTTK